MPPKKCTLAVRLGIRVSQKCKVYSLSYEDLVRTCDHNMPNKSMKAHDFGQLMPLKGPVMSRSAREALQVYSQAELTSL